MGPYKSLFVPMDSNGSHWVLIGPYASLWVQMGFLGSYASIWILMDPHNNA